MKDRKALLIVGSPKGKRSTSLALGEYLMAELVSRGMESRTVFLPLRPMTARQSREWLGYMDGAEVVVLAFPLYVDQLPAPLAAFLETAAFRDPLPPNRDTRLAGIVQCGFPEDRHNESAARILRHFADYCGYSWGGCLSMGMGGMAGGMRLDPRRGPLRRTARGLRAAAADLAAGREISPAALREFRQRPISRWLYCRMANLNFRYLAWRNGVYRRMRARPYAS